MPPFVPWPIISGHFRRGASKRKNTNRDAAHVEAIAGSRSSFVLFVRPAQQHDRLKLERLIRHVLMMDSTFPANRARWPAMTRPCGTRYSWLSLVLAKTAQLQRTLDVYSHDGFVYSRGLVWEYHLRCHVECPDQPRPEQFRPREVSMVSLGGDYRAAGVVRYFPGWTGDSWFGHQSARVPDSQFASAYT
jgi:hypothetical protein